jgi:hypothetical protein
MADTMNVSITSKYNPKTEKDYCCVPAVLQMIQERRGLEYSSQDEIGYQLGLIVPEDKTHLFSKIRTGRMPKTGWGTQTAKKQYSINQYFIRNKLPLRLHIYNIAQILDLPRFITDNLTRNNDLIICYNSRLLFGDGDAEHVSLIQEIAPENNRVVIIDPAIGVPKIRETGLNHLTDVLHDHENDNLKGFWIVSGIE